SAQTTTKHVNALYGATALDLARQGVYHIETGIGGVADTLIEKLHTLGGAIHYKQRVIKIEMKNGRAVGVWAQKGRKGKEQTFFEADFIIANTTPWDLNNLLGENSSRGLKRESARRKLGWGAFVLHLGVNADAIPIDFPDHHQIIGDMMTPLGETNSIFISLSPTWDTSRAPAGQRAMTITTHTTVSQWWDLLKADESAYYAQKEVYTQKMLAQVEKIIPNIRDHITLLLPGTPVTYQFYTDRHMGMVGGFPQTSLFKARSPRTGIANIRLVGDSIFPGQSTAGVSLGAIRVSDDVQRVMPIRKTSTSLIRQEAQS
ncbi:MAG: FAD-dependent oxidoreductase, partial [Phototrophicales bacterium]